MAISLDAPTFEDAETFVQAIRYARLPLCLTDPRKEDNPIVFANNAFCELTGYELAEIIGNNCRFLQGSETEPESVRRVRDVLVNEEVATVEITNYRKDGSAFVNALQLGPIYCSEGRLVFYFGSQLDVTESREAEARAKRLATAELRHRLLNIINVLSVIVRLTGEEDLSPAEKIEKIDHRIRAVGKAHLLALIQDGRSTLMLREIAEVILNAYAPNGAESYLIEGPDIEVGATLLTSLALVLHELATNAVKHGALSRGSGHVELTWKLEADPKVPLLMLRWQESGGPEVTPPKRQSGSKIVTDLMRASRGRLAYDWQPGGVVADAVLPLR